MITPQTEYPELAQAIGLGTSARLWIKREDMHPYGSHKGRSIPVMIDIKAAAGAKSFALSSSGNAALAAIRHIRKRNAHGDDLTLTVFTGKNINPEKKQKMLEEIGGAHVTVTESERPLQALFNLIKGIGGLGADAGQKVASLRQSTDPDALVGYQTLANEIVLVPDLSAVFLPVSSGTSAQAIAESLINHKQSVAVHIVQTEHTSPIANAFSESAASAQDGQDPIEGQESRSLADAIVDRVGHRKEELVQMVRATGGHGWVVNNADIAQAQKLIKEKTGIEVTGNGALALAGLMKAKAKGAQFKGSVMCVITGR